MAELWLLAWPAGHSLSPVMHNAALKEMGLPHRYQALEVRPGDLNRAVAAVRSEAVLGANVTVPHKQAVFGLLDSVSDAARQVGAVNTISHHDGGLHGDNTDVEGFLALLGRAGVNLPGDGSLKAAVLGAGGAARAAVFALAPHAELVLVNRTVERAEELARDFRSHAAFSRVERTATAGVLAGCQLVVNTTSVGMERQGVNPDQSPVEGEALPDSAVVIDMIYRPAQTRLLRLAGERGLRNLGGLEMLVQQGAASLRIWTGKRDVPVDTMREAALAALAA